MALPKIDLTAPPSNAVTLTTKELQELISKHSYEWALDALIEIAKAMNNGENPDAILTRIRETLWKYAGKQTW